MNGMGGGGGFAAGGGGFVNPQAPQQDLEMSMSPELLALLQQIAGTPEEQEMLGQEAQIGLGMLNTPGAQGMNVGGTYVASNPVEHLSVALQRAMGAKQYRGAQDEMMGNIAKQGAARSATMADILQKMLGGGGDGLQPDPYSQAPGPWAPPSFGG
jgi:hypothetical protein